MPDRPPGLDPEPGNAEPAMRRASYLIALGSNRRHVRHGGPAGVLLAALDELGAQGLRIKARSRTHRTAALGPAGRDFANAVAVVETALPPLALLALLKRTERAFGRRAARRWGPRVLDLDIILWSEGVWPDRRRWRNARTLAVPHRAMADRAFVLLPASEVAAGWRHPLYGLSVGQMAARLQSRH